MSARPPKFHVGSHVKGCLIKMITMINIKYFLLHCPRFDLIRIGVFSQLAVVPGLDMTSMDSKICVNFSCAELQI